MPATVAGLFSWTTKFFLFGSSSRSPCTISAISWGRIPGASGFFVWSKPAVTGLWQAPRPGEDKRKIISFEIMRLIFVGPGLPWSRDQGRKQRYEQIFFHRFGLCIAPKRSKQFRPTRSVAFPDVLLDIVPVRRAGLEGQVGPQMFPGLLLLSPLERHEAQCPVGLGIVLPEGNGLPVIVTRLLLAPLAPVRRPHNSRASGRAPRCPGGGA